MKTVYSYSFIQGSRLIQVQFVRNIADNFCGADHAMAHSVRRDFALSLIPAIALNEWLPLNAHEYLDMLASNGFIYAEYKCTHEDRNEVRLIIA